jgi:hypothetical protein
MSTDAPETNDAAPSQEPATGPPIKLDETAKDAAGSPKPVDLPENAETWIVRIDGVEHSVEAGTPEAQIRETLSMTYPGARDASITHDSVIIAGQKYKVLVFTKRGGTKGLNAVDELRLILITVPPTPITEVRNTGTFHPFLRGNMVFDELLAMPTDAEGLIVVDLEDTDLCTRLSALSPSTVAIVTLAA